MVDASHPGWHAPFLHRGVFGLKPCAIFVPSKLAPFRDAPVCIAGERGDEAKHHSRAEDRGVEDATWWATDLVRPATGEVLGRVTWIRDAWMELWGVFLGQSGSTGVLVQTPGLGHHDWSCFKSSENAERLTIWQVIWIVLSQWGRVMYVCW